MKKKILFILHIPPPVHGSSVVGLQIKDSALINNQYDCCYINLGTSLSIDEIGKQGFVKLFRFFLIWLKVLRCLIFFKPNLCYFAITAKGAAFYKDTSIVLLLKIFNVKLVYHLHNKGVSLNQEKWLDNLLYRFVFTNTDVVLLSKFLYPDIQKYVPLERVHYCPNGISDIKINTGKDFKNNDSNAVQILFLSNLIESKGVYVLIDACAILIEKQLSFYCTFVGGIGDINESQFIAKCKSLNLEANVSYLGKKYGNDKHDEFEKADLFVFPTYNDTFGIVNLEAMQHSIPVVSTFEGGIPDVVEDGVTGFLVPQQDVVALAEKIEILIKNPQLRKEMGASGRKKYEEQFTHNHFEKNMILALNTVLK